MTLRNKLRRLRKMPPAEVASRCRDRWQVLRDRAALRIPHRVTQLDFRRISQACHRIVSGMDSAQLAKLKSDDPGRHDALALSVIPYAEQVLTGRIKLLGADFQVDASDWNKDPLSAYDWPRHFYADVQIYELDADVKYVWELNRHQFIPPMAQAWLLTGDARFARKSVDLIHSWVNENPVYVGVHWTSALEVAIRAISWIWTLAGLKDWNGWHQATESSVVRSLADHATYLSNHLSYYSSPYNHLIGEASALYMLAEIMAEHPKAAGWRRRARSVLTNEQRQQFYADGFTVEQATGYHFFTLGFYFQAIIASRHFNAPMTGLERVVQRAAEAGAGLRRPDGQWPCIGDIDSARSIPTVHEQFWDFRGLCGLAASLFKNEPMGAAFRDQFEESFWLLGSSAVEWLRNLGVAEDRAMGILPDAGYAYWTGKKGNWVLLDCGPVGEGVHADNTPSVSHGHDDSLSVHLCLNGKDILQDSGMPRYAGPRGWVDAFRSAPAHNRVTVDGVPGVQTAGRLAWSNVKQETSIAGHLGRDIAFLQGLLKLGDDVSVERYLSMADDLGLWIVDHVKLDRPRSVHWFWHLPAAAALSLNATESKHETNIRGATFHLRTWCTESVACSIEQSRNGHPVGWHAPGYGVLEPGFRVEHVAHAASVRVLFVTHIGALERHLRLADATSVCEIFSSLSGQLTLPSALQGLSWEFPSVRDERYLVHQSTDSTGFPHDVSVTELTAAPK